MMKIQKLFDILDENGFYNFKNQKNYNYSNRITRYKNDNGMNVFQAIQQWINEYDVQKCVYDFASGERLFDMKISSISVGYYEYDQVFSFAFFVINE